MVKTIGNTIRQPRTALLRVPGVQVPVIQSVRLPVVRLVIPTAIILSAIVILKILSEISIQQPWISFHGGLDRTTVHTT